MIGGAGGEVDVRRQKEFKTKRRGGRMKRSAKETKVLVLQEAEAGGGARGNKTKETGRERRRRSGKRNGEVRMAYTRRRRMIGGVDEGE